MKPQNELALIVAYYLSRLDKKGYSLLGYKNFSEASKKVGTVLDVNPNTIRNMRDEFDPYHQNTRIGWKKELRGSRQKILQAFQNTDDETLLEIVKEVLSNKEFKRTEEYEDIHSLFGEKQRIAVQKPPLYIIRGPTGKAAESFFMEYFKKTAKPVSGKLIDSRDLGCGFDFEIQDGKHSYFIEVKGLSSDGGGVLFTNKEWQTAQKYKDKYYLVLVRNLSVVPDIIILQDPTSKVKATRNIYTTLQVSWSVTNKNLHSLLT